MVKISVASVLLVTTLLQLVVYSNTEDPHQIHLGPDGLIDERFNKIKDKVEKYTFQNVKNLGKGNFRLYISADFDTKPSEDEFEANELGEGELVWGNKMRKAADLVKIVSGMFDRDAIVIVVFPKITELTFWGHQFLEAFEKQIQSSHKDISIGRRKIHFYFDLEENKKDAIQNQLKKLREHNELIIIAANKDLNYFNFATKEWSNGAESVSQELIHEADTVEIRLRGKCVKIDTELTVGGFNPGNLADKMVGVFKAEGRTHPHQTLRVRLPNKCKRDLFDSNIPKQNQKLIEQYTDELIKNLRNQHLDVYGKEPRAVLQFASKNPSEDAFPNNAWIKMNADYAEDETPSYLALFNDREKKLDCIFDIKHQTVTKTDLSDIKSLSIEVHCHGKFFGKSTVCESDAKTLAEQMQNIIPQQTDDLQIIFYACDVGNEKGRAFVDEFLKYFKQKNIEVIYFGSSIVQSGSRPLVMVAKELNFVVNENNLQWYPGKFGGMDVNSAFGRISTKYKIKDGVHETVHETVFPKSEYDLI